MAFRTPGGWQSGEPPSNITGNRLRAWLNTRASERLAQVGAVSLLDLLLELGWIHPSYVRAWGHGTMPSVIEAIRVSPQRVDELIQAYFAWGRAQELPAGELRLTRESEEGEVELRYSAAGDEMVERLFRHQFLARSVSE